MWSHDSFVNLCRNSSRVKLEEYHDELASNILGFFDELRTLDLLDVSGVKRGMLIQGQLHVLLLQQEIVRNSLTGEIYQEEENEVEKDSNFGFPENPYHGTEEEDEIEDATVEVEED